MVIKIHFIAIVLASLLFAVFSHADDGNAVQIMSVQQAIEIVLRHNPELKSFSRNIDLAEENIDFAKAGYRPTIGAAGSVGYGRSETNFDSGVTKGVDKSASLTLTQPLFRAGGTLATIEQQQNLKKATEDQFSSRVQDKIIEIVNLYVETYRSLESIRVNKDNVNLLSEQLRATSARFEAGELTKTDVAQAEARLAQAEATQAQAEATYEVILSSLQEEIGVTEIPTIIYPDLDMASLPATLDSALSIGLRKNPKISETMAFIEAQKFDVTAQERSLYPTLDLDGSLNVSRNKSSGFLSSQDSANIGLSANMPLYQAGALRNNIRQSKIRKAQAEDDLNDIRQSVRDDIVSSWHQFKIIGKQITAREKQLEATQLAYKGVRLEEEVGARSILDVLDANQDVRDAELSLIEIRSDLVNAYYQLLGAMGLLSDSLWDKS